MTCRIAMLLADDFDEDSLLAPAVELAVEDLLPGPEVELSGGHRDDHFTAHHLTFDMRVSVVLACPVVMVLVDRFVRRQVLEPDLVVVMQSLLVIVDEDRGRDVHRVNQRKTFANATLTQAVLDLRRDVDKPAARRHVETKALCDSFS